MTNKETDPVDEAVELATRRTAEAQNRFVEVPPQVEEALDHATEVERRADDLATLAEEAGGRARSMTRRRKSGGRRGSRGERPA